MNCGVHRGVKLLENTMKIVEKILEKRLIIIATIDDMQFSFMPGKGTIDAIFILRWIQEEYLAKLKKLYMSFVDLEKSFDRVPKKVVGDKKEKLHDDEDIVTECSYLYDGLNSVGGCVAAVRSGTRLGWVIFGQCQDLLCGKKFPLNIK